MRAAAYCRVSSDEQVDGFSLDAQHRIIEEACLARCWTIAEVYVDEGKSARGDTVNKRPAFKRMVEEPRLASSMWLSSISLIVSHATFG